MAIIMISKWRLLAGPQEINHIAECLAISIDENTSIMCGESMSSREHGVKYRPFKFHDCLFGCGDLVSSSNIEFDDILLALIHVLDDGNLLVPLLLLGCELVLFLPQLIFLPLLFSSKFLDLLLQRLLFISK